MEKYIFPFGHLKRPIAGVESLRLVAPKGHELPVLAFRPKINFPFYFVAPDSAPVLISRTSRQIVVSYTKVDPLAPVKYYIRGNSESTSCTDKCTLNYLVSGQVYALSVYACIYEDSQICGSDSPPLRVQTLPPGTYVHLAYFQSLFM